MKSPQDMRIIQIDITNACIHKCSNCTRFCGHHKKPFFMDLKTFERAVDSLEGYVGTVGMMGGEPTLNPNFEEMALYLAKKRGGNDTGSLIRPQAHFMDEIHDTEMEYTFLHPCTCGGERRTVDGSGLWSAIGERYKKYYETIQDTMRYQALNDHSNVMYHQPGLISRKDLNIPDDEWIKLRDDCWIQNKWSACITPKGAFFCEIAGALDMLFDGPGGWEIEPGWWKRKPEEFGEQLRWCEICGIALSTFMRNANEEIDDVSPTLYEMLKKARSPGIEAGRINLLKIKDGVIAEESKAPIEKRGGDMPYTESYSHRFDEKNTNLFYKKIKVVRMEDYPDKSVGKVVYDEIFGEDHNTYLMLLSGNIEEAGAISALEQLVTNPGALLYRQFEIDAEDDYFKAKGGAEVLFINPIAHSISNIGWDRILKFTSFDQMVSAWESRKVVCFEPDMVKTVPTVSIEKGKRYAVFGAGTNTDRSYETIISGEGRIICYADDDVSLQGRDVHGFTVISPEELKDMLDKVDIVMIAKGPHYRKVKEMLLSWGLKEKDMAWI